MGSGFHCILRRHALGQCQASRQGKPASTPVDMWTTQGRCPRNPEQIISGEEPALAYNDYDVDPTHRSAGYFCCRWAECLFTHGPSIHLDDTLPSRGVPYRGMPRHGAKTKWTDHELPKAGTLTRRCVAGDVTLPVRRRPYPCCRACCRWLDAAFDGSWRSVGGSSRRSSPQ